MVPRFLEMSIESFTKEQGKMRDHVSKTVTGTPFGGFEDQVRRNMEVFERAFNMFMPFNPQGDAAAEPPPAPAAPQPSSGDELDALKRQMADMQQKLEKLVSKPEGSGQ
ncbi:hypothetical protein GCM10007301_25450 [Azorhizobium oxalatiphilum]|uniref:Polyhydroxyalkanoate synthesis repressor PhaR n=1 Tax=Azorhizobium oxalatiphilum TaxID=980631 RepID=A0A917BZE4_9HYPH|nr:hypothetical protein GCM10007301_25450 [Azorhizobium oxalatiphilum]